MTISNSGHDENGKYSGGQAGDQTGTEWQVRSWYNRPWDAVYAPPTEAIGTDVALLAKHAANNDKIGYDQSQRTTFYTQLMKAKDYDPANITTKCEADCSAGVAAIIIAVGKRKSNKKMAAVSKDCYTGNLGEALVNAGWKKHTASKYLTSDAYLGKGWVLLNVSSHTAINLTKGSKYSSSSSSSSSSTTSTTSSTSSSSKYTTGKYKVTAKSGLNVRKGAGTNYSIVKALTTGTSVSVTSTKKVGDNWWGKISSGWICMEQKGSAYVKKA